MCNVKEWSHVFKLDPNKSIEEDDLSVLCESGTDAIIIGGTDGVTFDNVFDLSERVQRYTVPCLLEVSTMEAIMPGFDGYLIPSVLNSKDKKFITGIQHEAIKEYQDWIPWNQMLVEGYCVLNEEAKVFKAAECELPSNEDVIAYAVMAEQMFHFPIFYLEYSGTFGNAELVKEVRKHLQQTTLFYGGGIESYEQAVTMKEHADVIVVGNVIYKDMQAALRTVKACRQ
ncbi:heptaprenylglyceryl phosphate synthase [Halobacillus andaensis]|uniref:Heptaprenylglyceryl phosphate synthase n=1 Tax=Halobacillus andaensis TaxID=1176239 RepID=A0A917B7Z1_HALAA|nr:heptaprenylglyceryl phosphate synthase [Halobacillus andaensis]MBP2005749.1 putative glycerol-1-phosphate prenyltransferase [Halobacillus andaensis]GGF26292.1 heptaprenylglyceryl phosphate synthase [Halobacillus andaensis]